MATALHPSIFSLLPHTPLASDGVPTPTLDEQSETESTISRLLGSTPPVAPASSSSSGGNALSALAAASMTTLRKGEHVQFLASTLYKLPGAYVSLDASKPWLLFWTLHSVDLLGIALDQITRDRAVETLLTYLSPLGGFSGGAANSHLPHLLPTYASISSLAIAGGPQPGGGWDKVAEARQDIYKFFMRCKRPDGGFVVCEGGEIDVRGTYCLLVVATLLDLLTPELLHNVDKFLSACQTYEGGFACASFSFPSTSPTSHRATLAEAHGGYTSCSLFSHFLLRSIPSTTSLGPDFPSPIDERAALRWSALMQGESIEAGGFRGRSNKLVDGCYGWWVGGNFPVLEELVKRTPKKKEEGGKVELEVEGEDKEEDWVDDHSSMLFNRTALQEFVLLAAQKESGGSGGLRDKPGKRPDLYHTCNNLSGLSIAQHHMIHSPSVVDSLRASFDTSKGFPAVQPATPEGGWASEEERQRVRKEVFANALGWIEDEAAEYVLGGPESRVNTTTPVFNILKLRLKPFIEYFYCQTANA